ncbi:MAG: LytTR family transcriptional regulator DNA-binding domain-containing protein [Muribaculaceae bacterium]|nr:LytTR family transcriptional regulator DNA-binding domain-containing protein [Muribaculaceae bacterium]
MSKNLVFNTSSELIRIPSDNMVYVVADGNYSAIITADGGKYVLTLQLGQIEHKIQESVTADDKRFIRIGKSLIVNVNYITYINPARQKLTLSDCRTFKHDVSASREALKVLKAVFEKEDKNE